MEISQMKCEKCGKEITKADLEKYDTNQMEGKEVCKVCLCGDCLAKFKETVNKKD